MCGIVGVLDQKSQVYSELVRDMTDVLKHRGPDNQGVWCCENVGLGHSRLSIIDLSSRGDQPMISCDEKVIITYNGEIYNFREIRKELESLGYPFKSATDTEVVLNAYREWGPECVERFNGMFAFAIWDTRKKILILARDRYGVKPLYYFHKNDLFAFASEVKALLKHPRIRPQVCIEALNEYFSFQNIFSDKTLFQDVALLEPGTLLEFSLGSGGIKKKKYWDYHFYQENSLSSVEYTEELSRLFEQAVTRQLVSDVEVGAYLSGGIDSNAITSVASRNIEHLKTFTIGFDATCSSGLEVAKDERAKAEALSRVYGTDHYENILKSGDMSRVIAPLVWHLEDLRVGQSYPNFYAAKLAGKFVKVVFSGAGGDELFAGYPWRYYRAVVNDDFEHYADKYYRYWMRLIPDRFKPDFYQRSIYPRILKYQTKDVFRSVLDSDAVVRDISCPEDYVNNSLYFEIKTFMHGLLMVEDKLSMAHSLETRVPFLDNDLVDFAMKIPVHYKLKNLKEVIKLNENDLGRKADKYFNQTHDGKIILRNVLSGYVPEYDPKTVKQGFIPPDNSWFQGESIEYIKDLLFDKDALLYEYIQPDMARKLMSEHFEGRHNRRLLIWSLLCFEWWLKLFIKGERCCEI